MPFTQNILHPLEIVQLIDGSPLAELAHVPVTVPDTKMDALLYRLLNLYLRPLLLPFRIVWWLLVGLPFRWTAEHPVCAWR